MRRFAPALLLVSLSALGQTWVQLADFPGTPRDDAASFTIYDKVYVGTGLDENFQLRSDWYVYDINSDTWDTIAALPASPRQYCTSFTLNDTGYLFGGLDANGPLNELWRYDRTTDTWDQRAPLPALGRYAAVALTHVWDYAYVCTGMLAGGIPTNETWKYDPITDAWAMRAPIPGAARHRAAAMDNAVIGGADSAFNTLSDVYRYQQYTDSWNVGPTMPSGRYSADAADGRLICGAKNTTDVSDSCWILAAQWDVTSTPFPPGGRRSGVVGLNLFMADINFLFYGTGSDNVQRYKDWWRYNLPGSSVEERRRERLTLFPDPADATVTLRLDGSMRNAIIEVQDMCGRTLLLDRANALTHQLDVSGLSNGGYIVTVRSTGNVCAARLIVRH
ncbi:MAG: T9SS type A sorting domain-containing protein [Flavobacteriales bacterium]|nr:T9SS type A sorting domain-containing protein [Flavobacteriales bacterium]